MKHRICGIGGCIYDEEKENIPFDPLPAQWTCPLCHTSKSAFSSQDAPTEPPATPAVIVSSTEEYRKLSAGEPAAVCSNLA